MAAHRDRKKSQTNSWLLLVVAIIGIVLLMIVASAIFGRSSAAANASSPVMPAGAKPPYSPDAAVPVAWQESDGTWLIRSDDGRIRDPRPAAKIRNPRPGHISSDGYSWMIPAPAHPSDSPTHIRSEVHGLWSHPDRSKPAVLSPYHQWGPGGEWLTRG